LRGATCAGWEEWRSAGLAAAVAASLSHTTLTQLAPLTPSPSLDCCALLPFPALSARRAARRDLKPNNILLNTAGHVVISDLGLTIKLRRHKLLKHLAGTVGYWSPEVLSKAGTYKASDSWSYGVMLYEMLSVLRMRADTPRLPTLRCDALLCAPRA